MSAIPGRKSPPLKVGVPPSPPSPFNDR
jgi:hypothetical protein